jgi:hypothetical protein
VKGTFNIRGRTLRSQSQCRYIVVACRPEDFAGHRWDGATNSYVPQTHYAFGPETIKRSDTLGTAEAAANRYGFVPGGWVTVFDTVTGEEVQ